MQASRGRGGASSVGAEEMSTLDSRQAASPHRQLLRTGAFLRLWTAGGFTNAMRWLEILVAGLFVFQVTHSAFAVAVVTMMRSVPMLVAGALAGVVAESLDRKRLLLAGQALNAATAALLALSGALGMLSVWQLAVASLASGLVWASEMAVRRRMAGEAAGEAHVAAAIALDSMTSSVTRMLGPILGGLAFEALGVAGAFAVAALGHCVAIAACLRLPHRQDVQELHLRAVPSAIAEAARIAARAPILRSVLVVTVVMNVFALSYTTVFPAWGERVFGASPSMIGLLAGAEPFGALIGAWVIATRRIPLAPNHLFVGGSVTFMLLLATAANLPFFALAWVLLALGGIGTAAFGAMQTTLVITNVAADARSRVLGLVTTCIGMGPAGILAAGALTDRFGPSAALTIMACTGAALALVFRQRVAPPAA
ncbi:MAG: MFS transporter [Alphaproteobacteria bacterium]|nr:MFS transporter [Alphaproteobacteria bacterium]